MQDIHCALKDMAHNVREAHDKIHKAHQWREKNKTLADWQRDMAKGHLDYNSKINDAAAKMIADVSSQHAADHRLQGKIDAYREWHAEVMEDAIEVMAMIAAYK